MTMNVSDQPTEYRESNDRSGSTDRIGILRDGVIGGVVAVLLSFLPLSTVLGGGVAGYLDRGDGRRGTAAGAVAGAIASLPYLLVGLYLGVGDAALPGPELALSPTIVIGGVTAFAITYAVGLGTLGGLLGGYMREERDRSR